LRGNLAAADLPCRSERADPGGTTLNQLDPNAEHSPVVVHHLEKRASDLQLRLADRITTFAGSMGFVWIHMAIFAFWIASGLFGADRYPFQFLTFVVSLEAIFLSTFVMIGQNRQAAFQQAKADHDFKAQELELRDNTELTRSITQLTEQIHAQVVQRAQATGD
jgi:uncharacterized membrane protein